MVDICRGKGIDIVLCGHTVNTLRAYGCLGKYGTQDSSFPTWILAAVSLILL